MDRAAALLLANHLRDIHHELQECILSKRKWKTSEILKPDPEGNLEKIVVVDKLEPLESLALTLERIAATIPEPARQ